MSNEPTDAEQSLDEAYTLKTPADSKRLYAGWADTYDAEFADSHGYIYPQQIAAMFEAARGDANPVLDIGAGTGLVAAHLSGTVDGIDISAEMLAMAGAKGLYRNRICADLTATLPMADASYGGFISAGTFTHGHVGPDCLPELLRIAKPGALFCLGIKATVFDEAGFGSAFAGLVADGEITPVAFQRVRYYVDTATHEHAGDTGLAAVFHRR